MATVPAQFSLPGPVHLAQQPPSLEHEVGHLGPLGAMDFGLADWVVAPVGVAADTDLFQKGCASRALCHGAGMRE